jgi:hypothetical protein
MLIGYAGETLKAVFPLLRRCIYGTIKGCARKKLGCLVEFRKTAKKTLTYLPQSF